MYTPLEPRPTEDIFRRWRFRQLAEVGRPNLLIHGRYLRYMKVTSDTWKVPQIHGSYLRYIYFVRRWQTTLLDTWKVPRIHGRYLGYMEGTSDTGKVPQIQGRYLRYMEGTSDTWKVTQIHCLRQESVKCRLYILLTQPCNNSTGVNGGLDGTVT